MKHKDYEKPAIHIVEVRPQLLYTASSDGKAKRRGYHRDPDEDEDEDIVWE